MNLPRTLIQALVISAAALLLTGGQLYAQEKQASGQQDLSDVEPDILWLWGEASSVDADKGIITVKYLDYETDTEKEAVIYADEKTTYENVSAITDIKPKDIVSVDYVTGAQGSNVARNISVEKPDDIQPPEEIPASAASEAPAADSADTAGAAKQ